MKFVSEVFAKGEPLAVEMGVKSEDLLEVLMADIQQFQQLSSIAFNPTTMNILGVFLSSDP